MIQAVFYGLIFCGGDGVKIVHLKAVTTAVRLLQSNVREWVVQAIDGNVYSIGVFDGDRIALQSEG